MADEDWLRGTMARHTARGLERPVPKVPWMWVLGIVVMSATLAIACWEIKMREVGLHAGDLGDEQSSWTVERRKVDAGPRDSIVLVGDSRLLFDSDLSVWERLVGQRPIQLALAGTNPRSFLHDLAADEHFAGLLVVDVSESIFFRDRVGLNDGLLDYLKKESPSQRVGHRLYEWLSRYLAFLDPDYTPLTLIERQRWPERIDPSDAPYNDIWKLSETFDDRQTAMWYRIEEPGFLQTHARLAWNGFEGKPVAAEMIAKVVATTKADIERIRARGGEVVFLRPPSRDPIRANEQKRAPRALSWDRLLRETGSFGVHFEDYPEMQQLELPEYSHLSRASAVRFTDAYVRVMRAHVPHLAALARAHGLYPGPSALPQGGAAAGVPAAVPP
jgi:hypothetical protein